jgi:alkylation response protein AidB-like acyl-CoA dehydrogenase
MIGFELSEEQQLLQATARGFAESEIRPLVVQARGQARVEDSWAMVRPMFARGVDLGFTRIFVPEIQGGMGGSCLDAAILLEELGAADVGIASDFFALTATMPLMMLRAGSEAQRAAFLERFAAGPMVLGGAQSEPNVAGSELMMGGMDKAFGPRLRARRDGDSWVLSGQKSAFITNAGIADQYFIIARTDPDKPPVEGMTIFEVAADAPGLRIGRNTELIGWPLTHHAELHFDEVRLSPDKVVGSEGSAAMVFAQLPEMGICLAACFVGLARAVYEYALAYAKERKSLGQPIAQHQAIALKLAEMAIETQSARLMVWDAARACETDPMAAALFKGPAAKTKAVDVAIRNAELCVQVLGGYGVTREYEAGRFLNDAWIGYSCDFTRDILHLSIARML